jgi:hypothetical protein
MTPSNTDLRKLDDILVSVFSDADIVMGTNEAVAVQIARKRLLALFTQYQQSLLRELVEQLPRKQKINKDERNDGYGNSTYYKNGRNGAIDEVREVIQKRLEEMG